MSASTGGCHIQYYRTSFQSLTFCMGISMRRASVGKGQGGGRGGETGVAREGKGELQSRSLTWGARVMFKRQFWHPADPLSPTFFNRRRRRRRRCTHPPAGGTTLLESLCPPFEGLPRLLLTDRTKLASPVSPKPRHWNCTNTLRDSGDSGVAPYGCFARSIGSSCTRC